MVTPLGSATPARLACCTPSSQNVMEPLLAPAALAACHRSSGCGCLRRRS
ncbi:MAG: hypothetical protein RMK99_12030 [Anaerolineales bacterium]|nr:hypothetical protein [Anaerolineales bacterium]